MLQSDGKRLLVEDAAWKSGQETVTMSKSAEPPRADLLDYKIPLIFLVGLMAPYITALWYAGIC